MAVDPDDVLAGPAPTAPCRACLPPIGADVRAGHRLAAVPFRIEAREALFEAQVLPRQRRDHDAAVLDRDPHLLIGIEAGLLYFALAITDVVAIRADIAMAVTLVLMYLTHLGGVIYGNFWKYR